MDRWRKLVLAAPLRLQSYTEAQANADPAKGWLSQYTLDATGARLIVGMDGVANPSAPADPSKDTYLASWCGQVNCNSAGFSRGVATNWGGTWTELDMTGLPNRFPNAVTFDPGDATNSTIYLVFNGFNRKFIEGPGAGVKHVYRGKLAKNASGVSVTWTDLSVGFPDVPATDVVVVGNKLVVATDLAVFVADKRATPEAITWQRVGLPIQLPNLTLPLTTVFDLHVSGDGFLYAATRAAASRPVRPRYFFRLDVPAHRSLPVGRRTRRSPSSSTVCEIDSRRSGRLSRRTVDRAMWKVRVRCRTQVNPVAPGPAELGVTHVFEHTVVMFNGARRCGVVIVAGDEDPVDPACARL
jgi:hypothetical protein